LGIGAIILGTFFFFFNYGESSEDNEVLERNIIDYIADSSDSLFLGDDDSE
jgi:hypothetical protein